MPKLVDLTLREFDEKLACQDAVPGGGSVSALAGSLGSALVKMVGLVTQGKKGYEDAQECAELLVEQGGSLQTELLDAVDKDAEAFDLVMNAFKMPKETDEQKAARSANIQAGYKRAAEVPLGVAMDCLATAEMACTALERGNSNAASDAGVAALVAIAGAEGALLNVWINLSGIKDAEFVKEYETEGKRILAETQRLRGMLWGQLSEKIQGLPNA